jgi:ferredoxin
MVDASALNTLQYDPGLCIGCEMCRVAQLVHPGVCMECGACQLNCPTGAILVDSGVGCAAAMIRAALRGETEASCGGF